VIAVMSDMQALNAQHCNKAVAGGAETAAETCNVQQLVTRAELKALVRKTANAA
jgi:hypothetical protein